MANFYIAVTVKQDRNETVFEERKKAECDPGFYAYVVKCSESDNLKSVLARIGGLVFANIFQTKKKASETARLWNEGYKANGTYLYDVPSF